MSAGTYKVTVGDYFYVGSSFDVQKRLSQHYKLLVAGRHPIPKLQSAFLAGGTVSMEKLYELPRERGEAEGCHRDRIRAMEQDHLDFFKGDPYLANRSTVAHSPLNVRVNGKRGRKKGHIVSESTREKMAAAKRGSRNIKSRPVVVVDLATGIEQRFDTVSSAAKWFRVSQQLMDQWIKGIVAWPGTSRKNSSAKNAWVAQYRANIEDSAGIR